MNPGSSTDDRLLEKLAAPFVFAERGEAIDCELRPLWRLSTIALILKICGWAGKASLRKLYVLSWALRSPRNRERFLSVIHGVANPEDLIIRFEPSLLRALHFGAGMGLFAFDKGKRITLQEKGRALVEEALKGDCLAVEQEFLRRVRKHVYERDVDRLLRWEQPT